jgi:hypothetical protein
VDGSDTVWASGSGRDLERNSDPANSLFGVWGWADLGPIFDVCCKVRKSRNLQYAVTLTPNHYLETFDVILRVV